MNSVTFIHCADLHLDSPIVSLNNFSDDIIKKFTNSSFASFSKIVDLAIERKVDFIIIAGDIYDSEDRSVRAQVYFKKEMERLHELSINVYIIHGNHDHLNGVWTMIDMPNNVHVFSSELESKQVTTKCGTKVSLHGFSYEKRHIFEDRTEGFKRDQDSHYNIGILHGHGEGTSGHSPYAPFQLSKLVEKHFNYWALGHIHKRAILHENPYVVYSGNIQGRNRKELGEKGCYVVTLNNNETDLEFVNTAPLILDNLLVDGANLDSFDDLLQLALKSIDKIRRNDRTVIISLTVKNISNNELLKDSLKEDLLHLLNENELNYEEHVLVDSLNLEEGLTYNRQQLRDESPFYNDLFATIDSYDNFDESLSFLLEDHRIVKFINGVTEEESRALLQEAEQLIIKMLRDS